MTAVPAHRPLIESLFAAIDAKDTDGFLEHLAADAVFRFGSAPAVSGHDAIRSAVDGFFASIAALRHRVDLAIANGSTLVCEGEVTYERHDATEITLPFANVFELANEMITGYRIYIDIAPLYAN